MKPLFTFLLFFFLTSFISSQAMNPYQQEDKFLESKKNHEKNHQIQRMFDSMPTNPLARTTISSITSTSKENQNEENCNPTDKNYQILEPLLRLKNETMLTLGEQQEIVKKVLSEYSAFNYFWHKKKNEKETSSLLKQVADRCRVNYEFLQQIEEKLQEYNFSKIELALKDIEIFHQPGNIRETLPFHNFTIQRK